MKTYTKESHFINAVDLRTGDEAAQDLLALAYAFKLVPRLVKYASAVEDAYYNLQEERKKAHEVR